MFQKKWIILVVLTIILASCSTQDTEDTPLTFRILYNETAEVPFREDWAILEEYFERKNVSMEFVLGDNENFEEAINLNLNSDNPPDVILKCWPDTIEAYANEGLLLAINDYEHLLPHYQDYIESNHLQNEVESLEMADGKYYILPGYQRDLQVQQWIYRKDIFEQHNIPTPTTYEDMYDALSVLKGLYPDSSPLTASWGGAHLFSMMGAGYGIPAGWSGTRYYDETEQAWTYAPATDNYKEMHRYLNRLYSANLLDPEVFSQTNEDFINKLVDGRAFVTVTWISSGFDNWNQQLEENGISGGHWEPLPVMESTIGMKGLPPVNQFRKGLVVTAEAASKPYFEEMMEFLDWAIYSEEGLDLTYWGVEGDTYHNTDDGKMFFEDILTSKNPNGSVDLKESGYDLIFNLCENEEYEDYKKPQDIVAFLERSEEANETLENMDTLVLSNDAIEMDAIITSGLATYVNEASIKFITGEYAIDSEWDMYVSELERLGYQTLENIWNTAWQELEE